MQQSLSPQFVTSSRFGPWVSLLTLCIGLLMTGIDATAVNVAVPAIKEALDADLNTMVWLNSAYALCYAVPLILAGRLGDRYGPKRVFLIGLTLFTAASLGCAVATDPVELIIGRVGQGLGAALILPQTMVLIVHLFPSARRGRALGVWGAVGAASMALGPVVGGVLVTAIGWRAIFLINVPIGVLALIGAVVVIPDWRPTIRRPFDVVGAVLSGVGVFAVIFAVQSGDHYRWSVVAGYITIWHVGAFGIVAGIGFIVWEHFHPHASLVPLRLFRGRDFTAACGANAAMGAATGGLFLPLMFHLQSGLGFSATAAGLSTVPMFVIAAFCARIAGILSDTVGGKPVAVTGFGLLIIGSLLVVLRSELSLAILLPSLVICGIGLGTVGASLAGLAMRIVEPDTVGAAAGVFNSAKQIGGALGVAATGALLQMYNLDLAYALRAALTFASALYLVGLICSLTAHNNIRKVPKAIRRQ